MPKYEGMVTPEARSLGRDEAVSDRPFTAVELQDEDLRCLRGMLRDLRRVLEEIDSDDRTIKPYQRLAWRVDGLTHRLLICDEMRLRAHPDLCVVGFFAERRSGVDFRPLDEANTAIVGEFAKYPGILSYSSLELANGGWGNLVLHDDPVDPDYWRRSELHAKAVSHLSPIHYKNVRIHNARLTAPVMDRPRFMVKKTKYFDYSGEQEWRAERTLIPD
jgi:hypothetical protein